MTHVIDILLYEHCVALDVVGPHEVFALAASMTRGQRGRPAYRLRRVAMEVGDVHTASSLKVVAEHACDRLDAGHTLIVPGGVVRAGYRLDPQIVQWVQAHARDYERVAGVCTGAFYLAQAGLLDGRSATTHWASASRFAARYPQVDVRPDSIFERSGAVWTSAGVTAGIDLALAMVEEDCGHGIALQVAQELVVFLRRPGGQSQFSVYMQADAVEDDRVGHVQQWIAGHLTDDLRVPQLAKVASMSPRHFSRVFRAQTGVSPAQYVERCRIEAARNALESSSSGLHALASQAGFASAEVLRRAFRRHFGVSPSVYRATIATR